MKFILLALLVVEITNVMSDRVYGLTDLHVGGGLIFAVILASKGLWDEYGEAKKL